MDITFKGTRVDNQEPVIGNGYYGDNKMAWIVQVTPTEYGRSINKVEVITETVELIQTIENKVREKIIDSEEQAKHWKDVGHYINANYYEIRTEAFEELFRDAKPLTAPKYNYTEWKD